MGGEGFCSGEDAVAGKNVTVFTAMKSPATTADGEPSRGLRVFVLDAQDGRRGLITLPTSIR